MAKIQSPDDIQRSIPQPIEKRAVDQRQAIPSADPAFRAQQNLAGSFMKVSDDLTRIDMQARRQMKEEQERIDNLRAEEALNKLREKRMQLTLGEENGFTRIQGSALMNRKTPILDDYSKMMDDSIEEIATGLTSDSQREKFRVRAKGAAIDFKTDLTRHVMQEGERYKTEVADNSIKTEETEIAMNWFSSGSIDKSKARISAVIDDAYADKSPEWKSVKVRESMERINAQVVTTALSKGEIGYAEEYLKNNSGMMAPSDMIKLGGEIQKVKEGQMVDKAVEVVTTTLPKMLNPNDGDRLLDLIADAESGNRDYDSKGNMVTSPRGALGRMQVMPDTAKNPGFGIRPAKDQSPEELARVGKEYFNAMLVKYKGNVPQALAAYNYGPDATDKAIKKAEKDGTNWLANTPEETQKYVSKITARFGAGETGTAEPTLADVQTAVKASLKAQGAPAHVVKEALTKAEKVFNDARTARNQESEDILTNIYARVDSGDLTDYNQLTPDELSKLGSKRISARAYIDSTMKREDDLLKLSPAATTMYYSLYTDPVALKSKSISEIMDLSPELGQSRVNSLLQKRADYINSPEKLRAATIDSDAFNSLAMRFGYNIRNKKQKDELIIIKDRAEQAIETIQSAENRTLTREDKDKIIKRMMVEFPEVKARYRPGSFGAVFGSDAGTMSKRGYQIENPANIVVPDNIKQQIIALHLKNGQGNPTDSMIRDTYVDYLMTQNGIK